MTDIIERMARAIEASNIYGKDWDALPEARKSQLRLNARAALKEIQEPTEEMVLAGYETDDYVQGHDCRAIWMLMAGKALKG